MLRAVMILSIGVLTSVNAKVEKFELTLVWKLGYNGVCIWSQLQEGNKLPSSSSEFMWGSWDSILVH